MPSKSAPLQQLDVFMFATTINVNYDNNMR